MRHSRRPVEAMPYAAAQTQIAPTARLYTGPAKINRRRGPFSSGSDPLDPPFVVVAHVPKPVVHAVFPALPELDDVRLDAPATPVRRRGNLPAAGRAPPAGLLRVPQRPPVRHDA